MTPLSSTAAVLVAIAALAALRQAWHAHRRGDAPWRIALLVLGQAALAAALWRVLVPPARSVREDTLVVLTADAPKPPVGPGTDHVALPEAPAFAGIARVPDLGTALRRHPEARALRVLGAGLASRDRDAAARSGLRLAFEPAPLPAGVVALEAPTRVPAGRRFDVRGRVEGAPSARLELLDPAGRRVDVQPVHDDGGFALSATAGPAGRTGWTLRRRDAADAVVETVPLPVDVAAAAPLRVLALAGGAGPEQKYLARWARDAGLALQARASVGAGVDVGAPTPPLTRDGLRDVDLVILDDRQWRELGDGGRAALRDAVRDGVGVLLRLTGDPSDADRMVLKAWGFAVAAANVARSVELPGTAQADPGLPGSGNEPAPADAGAAVDAAADDRAPVPLSRRALRLSSADGAPLLRDAAGEVLAVWRAEGRGRMAVWNLADSFRLQLSGRRAAYGSLWADAASTLARARGDGAGRGPRDARVGERVALCGIGEAATLQPPGPDAAPIRLVVDPATGAAACAAAWPTQPGWHTLRDGDRELSFPVRARDEATGLQRRELAVATQALAARAVDRHDPQATSPAAPGPRWPWLLAWLAIAAALWALERSARGRGH
jgi:hypothetical protein